MIFQCLTKFESSSKVITDKYTKMENMTYEQTIELEENIKLKNLANSVYQNFLKNVKLDPSKHKGNGKFEFWSDQYNATYFQVVGDRFVFICEFLHENYEVPVTPSGIFNALKMKYRGVDHLVSAVRDK